MEGRARDQRDHGRRGPAAAEFLGIRTTSRPSRGHAGSARSSATTAPGPTSRRARPTCPRRSRPTSRCGWPATRSDAPHMRAPRECILDAGRASSDARVHPDLARAVRAVVVGRPAGNAAGADLPAAVGPAQHLRLGLLGAADGRAADRRVGATGRSARCRSASTSCATASSARAALPAAAVVAGRVPAPRPAAARYERRPSRRFAGCALEQAEPGSSTGRRPTARWGGIQPPWVYSLIALHLLGLPARSPG